MYDGSYLQEEKNLKQPKKKWFQERSHGHFQNSFLYLFIIQQPTQEQKKKQEQLIDLWLCYFRYRQWQESLDFI